MQARRAVALETRVKAARNTGRFHELARELIEQPVDLRCRDAHAHDHLVVAAAHGDRRQCALGAGGFFVAVFHKHADAPAAPAPPLPLLPVLRVNGVPAAATASKKSKKAAKKHFKSEEAWCTVPQEVWTPIVKSYGLNDSELHLQQLFMRRIDVLSASVKKIYCCSVGCSVFFKRGCSTYEGDPSSAVDTVGEYMRRLRILSFGLRLFERIGSGDASHLLSPCPPALMALQPSLSNADRTSRRFIWLKAESWGILLHEKRLHIDAIVHEDERKILRHLFKYEEKLPTMLAFLIASN